VWQHLTFENSRCLSGGSALGFSLKDGSLLIYARGAASDHDGGVDAGRYHLCANLYVAECNWIVGSDDGGPRLARSAAANAGNAAVSATTTA
jgi:hypothetical protein